MIDNLIAFMFFAQESLGGGAAAPGASPAAGAPPGAGPPRGSAMEPIIFLVLMLVVFYFFLIRPQQKKAKKHKEMIGQLKRGDTVITSSGIKGRIHAIDGQWVTVEVAKNTRIEILKNFVGGVANEATEQELVQQPR